MSPASEGSVPISSVVTVTLQNMMTVNNGTHNAWWATSHQRRNIKQFQVGDIPEVSGKAVKAAGSGHSLNQSY